MTRYWKYILIIGILFSPTRIIAQETNLTNNEKEETFSYFTTFSLGVEFGDIRELVYHPLFDDEGNRDGSKTLSELQWQHLFSPYILATTNLRHKKFFLDIILRSSIPTRVGEVYNSDFLFPDSSERSHFSMHENYLDKNISFALLAKIPFRVHPKWTILPLLGITIEDRKWSAQNGYTQYPSGLLPSEWEPITEDSPKESIYGSVISYRQFIVFPSFGLENQIELLDTLIINLGTTIYPYIFIHAIDYHYLRQKEFKDRMHGFFGIKSSISASLFPFVENQDIGLVLAASFETYATRGDTIMSDIGVQPSTKSSNFFKDGAGSKSSIFSISVGVSFYPDRQ